MKRLNTFFCIISISLILTNCNSPYQQPVVVQQPVAVQQSVPNYEIRTDAYGNQVVYYTDPVSNASLFIDMVLWNSLISQSGGYYNVHNYYVGHPSYFTSSYSRYHTSYTRSYYRSSSDGGARFRSRIPNNPSSSSVSSTPRSGIPTGRAATPTVPPARSSMPSGRTSMPTSSSMSSSRSSMPSGRSTSSFSSGRSSMPSGRRH